jgi:hypothetical protein
VTRDLDHLAVRDAYNGNEQIYQANGTGMHIGHFIIRTPDRNLSLSNMLNVPQCNIPDVKHII